MKNVLKWAFAVLALCLIASLSSCGRIGGTIIVKNNYSRDKEITIYSDFKEPNGFGLFQFRFKYGLKTINAGSTGTFNVNTNTKYGIVWHGTVTDEYKIVEISNGKVVKISIP
jgi:hypothetical protein